MTTTTHNLPYRKPNGELYLFVYDDEHKSDVLRTLARWASDPGIAFDWNDAAVVSQRMREPNRC
jgi:hypothetical protein